MQSPLTISKEWIRFLEILINWRRLKRANLGKTSEIKTNKLRILFATNISGQISILNFDVFLMQVLRKRGHEVSIVQCARALPACQLSEYNKFNQKKSFERNQAILCRKCNIQSNALFKTASIKPIKLTSNVNSIEKLELNLENATSGTKRYFAVGNLEKEDPLVLPLFSQASRIANSFYDELLSKREFDLVIAHHGIYVPQGDVISVAKSHNIPIITWHQAYRRGCFIFSWGDTYHRTMIDEVNIPKSLTEIQRNKIREYLHSRQLGEKDWIYFHPQKSKPLEFDWSRKTAVMFTNVIWDAQLHYSNSAFESMEKWIRDTVIFFKNNPEINLIIRIHPGEISGRIKSRQNVKSIISSTVEVVPPNITIVDANEHISSYDLMDKADIALVYATKASIELACKGKEVVVAGDAWVKNKGFTHDPKNEYEYFDILNNWAIGRLEKLNNIEQAEAFAFHFFFNKMFFIKSIKILRKFPYFKFRRNELDLIKDPDLFDLITRIENFRPLAKESNDESTRKNFFL